MRTAILAALLCSACAVTIDGEQQERDRAAAAGSAWQRPFAERELAPLQPGADVADWIARAEAQNGDLEARWHEWIAAIEQVPEAATQDSNAMLGLEHRLDGGKVLDRTGLMLMSDAMNNLVLPGRLRDRAEAALAAARTAGAAFAAARLRLQRDVAERAFDLALQQRLLALQERLRAAFAVAVPSLRARVAAGQGSQRELLAAEIELARADADLARLRGELPAAAAALCAQAGVDPRSLPQPTPPLPAVAPLANDEQTAVELALQQNPALEVRRKEHERALAEVTAQEWARVPEFSLRGLLMGDGILTLTGAFTLPFLRDGAIEASIQRQQARARAAEAMRRQAATDATAMALAQLAQLRAIAEQDAILQRDVLPRLSIAVELARTEWTAARAPFADWAAATAMQIEVESMQARLQRDAAVLRAQLAETIGGR